MSFSMDAKNTQHEPTVAILQLQTYLYILPINPDLTQVIGTIPFLSIQHTLTWFCFMLHSVVSHEGLVVYPLL